MITKKHDNIVYLKRGDSIAEYSQKTYNLIKASNIFKDMHDVVSLFVPGNSSVTCRSGDIYNRYQTPTDDRNVMFMITPNIKEGMSIKSGYLSPDFKDERAYILKPKPKSIRANSGTIKIDGIPSRVEISNLVEYGPKTSLPVVLIKNNDGISITHELGNELYAEVMLKDGMKRKVTF